MIEAVSMNVGVSVDGVSASQEALVVGDSSGHDALSWRILLNLWWNGGWICPEVLGLWLC